MPIYLCVIGRCFFESEHVLFLFRLARSPRPRLAEHDDALRTPRAGLPDVIGEKGTDLFSEAGAVRSQNGGRQ